MPVAPDDVAADHRVLLLVTAMAGAVEREVAQRREVALHPVHERRLRGHVRVLGVVRGRPLADATVLFGRQMRRVVVPTRSRSEHSVDTTTAGNGRSPGAWCGCWSP